MDKKKDEKRKASEKYLARFDLPVEESLVKEWKGAYKGKSGHIYLFQKYICFFAKTFGYHTKVNKRSCL